MILKPQDPPTKSSLWAGYPQVYPRPIYSIPPTISILSILYYLSAILQDRGISHRIYQPGCVGNGPGTAEYPPGGVAYERDIAKCPMGGDRSGRLCPQGEFSIF